MSSSRSSPTSEPLAVARVMGVRGLGGELRVMPLTDLPGRLDLGSELVVEGEDVPRRVVATATARHGLVLRLAGIDDRAVAAALIGRHLTAVAPAAPLPGDHYWWHQLEGLAVEDTTGRDLGRLEEVFRAGGNEVYRVVGTGTELLVPALRSVVMRIDLEAGVMVIRDPADWLEAVEDR